MPEEELKMLKIKSTDVKILLLMDNLKSIKLTHKPIIILMILLTPKLFLMLPMVNLLKLKLFLIKLEMQEIMHKITITMF
jgi:hypothetical protein